MTPTVSRHSGSLNTQTVNGCRLSRAQVWQQASNCSVKQVLLSVTPPLATKRWGLLSAVSDWEELMDTDLTASNSQSIFSKALWRWQLLQSIGMPRLEVIFMEVL